MTHRFTHGRTTFTFPDLATLMAKASPRRSGDELAGLAAASAEERVAAQVCLADVPLTRFLEEPLIPPEQDEVTRLILDRHDRAAFAPVGGLTVGQFRDWLLRYETDGALLAALAPGLTPEMVAAVSKLMRQQDLILVASKIRNGHPVPQHPRPARHAGGAASAQPPGRRPARHRGLHPGRPDVWLRRCRDRHQSRDRQSGVLP